MSTSRLSRNPFHARPYRWLPRHGEPICVFEWLTQRSIKMLAWAPAYTALVVTIVLLLVIFGVPWVEGR